MLMSSWHRLPSSHVLRKRRKACQPIPGSSNPIALSRSVSQRSRSEEHTSELQSRLHLVCRLLLEKKKNLSIIYCHDPRMITRIPPCTLSALIWCPYLISLLPNTYLCYQSTHVYLQTDVSGLMNLY